MELLVELGHDVYVIAPRDDYVSTLESIGVEFIDIEFDRYINLWKDIKYVISLYKIFKRERFDIIHTWTIKPNLYGSIVAFLAGNRRIFASITGLGYLFKEDPSIKIRITRAMVRKILFFSFRLCKCVTFQNDDDGNQLVREGVLPKEKVVVIKGSGVVLSNFSSVVVNTEVVKAIRACHGILESDIVVFMAARASESKGVNVLLEASRILSSRDSRIRIFLAGEAGGDSIDSISEEVLKKNSGHHFAWVGFQKEIREWLAIADIAIYPSHYREGIPRFLLESLAMGKPIVTTNNVGCREVVDEGVNGYLVPIKDPVSLAQAVEKIITEDLFFKFGRESLVRSKAFDHRDVARRTVALYEILPQKSS